MIEGSKIFIKKRRSGQTFALCNSAYPKLLNGEWVGIVGGDVSFVNRIIEIFKIHFSAEVIAEEIKELRPRNNRKMHYDKFGEPVGIEFLPQQEEVIGYKLSLKKPIVDYLGG